MKRNCPFYGCALLPAAFSRAGLVFALFGTRGNQCALITTAHSPCILEIHGQPVEWSTCERVDAIRLGELPEEPIL